MQFHILDEISEPGGSANEDRAGFLGKCAWVIDGATDVIDAPLTKGPSDASWFAAAMNEELLAWAQSSGDCPLQDLPQDLAQKLNARFRAEAIRAPEGPDEQPSASAMIVRLDETTLSYLTLGDCALIIKDESGRVTHIGDDEEKAGDTWVAKVIGEERAKLGPDDDAAALRKSLWPKLRLARRAMNSPDGYGIFSITPAPAHFIRHGSLAIAAPSKGIICSDGLMRLVDVMHRYTVEDLFNAILARGLKSLVTELRILEEADATCLTYPRAKQFDDTTAILFEIS